jgi:hypothetical protein
MTTDIERIRQLSNIIHSYAPNSNATKLVNQKLDWNRDATIKDYVMALADGLLYGNWPWVTLSKPKTVELEDFASFDPRD